MPRDLGKLTLIDRDENMSPLPSASSIKMMRGLGEWVHCELSVGSVDGGWVAMPPQNCPAIGQCLKAGHACR